MKNTRRNFLKVAGITALGVAAGAGKAAASYLPHYDHMTPSPEARTAKRWGMVIDTRKFHSADDYKPLIEACHSYHNVPEFDGPQEIKWMWLESFHHTFPHAHAEFMSEDVEHRPFPLLCNHCEEPPCVRVCPTQATFKREDGIVMMDMHRCIGCRFCMAGCPYGSRSFNFQDPRKGLKKENPEYPTRTKGVVEKCDFCVERLAQGKMPACVEAAEGKILFGDLEDKNSEVRRALAEHYTIRRKPDLGTSPSVFYII
ncbi:4Fe-4S dicluster domain-containing protein [Desulfobaculum senezii]|jgi:molybdopterin-containing oxidoreductase family iron-sulfur binding subunit